MRGRARDCTRGQPRYPVQRAYRGRRPDHFRSRMQARSRRHCVEAEGLGLSLGALAGLAQNEELRCSGGEARSRGGLGQNETAIMAGNNRIMIFGPKSDGLAAAGAAMRMREL